MTKPRTDPLRVRLSRLRDAAGWTQLELAVRAGLSLQTIAGIEQGKRVGSARTLRKLAAALKVGVDILDPGRRERLARRS